MNRLAEYRKAAKARRRFLSGDQVNRGDMIIPGERLGSKQFSFSDLRDGNNSEIGAMVDQFHNNRRAQEGYQLFKGWVYICVNAIAKAVAKQQWNAGAVKGAKENPTENRDPHAIQRKTINAPPFIQEKAARSDNNLEVLESHDSLDVLSRPNPVQKSFEFTYMQAANLLITGESYIVGGIVKDEGEEERLWMIAIPSNWIRPVKENGKFTGWKLMTPGNPDGISLAAENVSRTFLPNPSNPFAAMSPLAAAFSAITIDQYIQDSQQQAFENGINPNLIVTIGKQVGPDGKLSDKRPEITGAARRQIVRAIREIVNQTSQNGDPMIIDGLIESVHKLQSTPQEMDWHQSGEIVKKRIMQTYAVNPYIVGEVDAANRAQAVVAEQTFCTQAVNPIISALSESMTDFVGPIFADPERLVLWLDECHPIDEDLKSGNWNAARAIGDVTEPEYRKEILNLPPLEPGMKIPALRTSNEGLTNAIVITQAVAAGSLPADTASLLIQHFFQFTKEEAEAMVSKIEVKPPPAPAVPLGLPAPDGELDEDEEDSQPFVAFPRMGPKAAGISRDLMKAFIKTQQGTGEEDLARQMAGHFPEISNEHSEECC